MEGVFLKDYPPEAFTIRCLEDSQAFLQTEGAYQRFEEYLKTWMKKIQELLFDSEQLRRETDNLGPQVQPNSQFLAAKRSSISALFSPSVRLSVSLSVSKLNFSLFGQLMTTYDNF